MFKKNDSGMAIVGAILLMLILVVLGQAMIMLTNHESIQEVRGRLKDSALYVADAGIEKAIYNIKNKNYIGFTENVGLGTGSKVGEAIVTITSLGSDKYRIDSIGYVPSQSDERGKRKIRAVVEVDPEQPEEALRSVGPITIASNSDVHGTLRSNSKITFNGNNEIFEDDNGNCDVITSTGIGSGVYLGGNVTWNGSGSYYIRANGPTNADKGGDTSETGVYLESRITGNVTVVENAGVEPIPVADIPFYDKSALKSDAENNGVVYETHQTYNNSNKLDLNGQVHWFKQGVDFNSNGIIDTSSGTIFVTGDSESDDYPLELSSNIGDSGNYQKMNLIVDDEAGLEKSMDITSNVYIQGYIYSPGNLVLGSNVRIKGVIEVGGDSTVSANVDIFYDEIGYAIPGGGSGGVTIISWQETK